MKILSTEVINDQINASGINGNENTNISFKNFKIEILKRNIMEAMVPKKNETKNAGH